MKFTNGEWRFDLCSLETWASCTSPSPRCLNDMMRKVVKPTNRGQAAASTQRRGACKMQMRAGSGSPARTQRTKGEENLSSANQIKLSPKNHHHHPLSQSNQIVPRLEICPCVLKLALDRIIPLPYLLRAGYTKRPSLNLKLILSSENNLLVFTYRDLRKVRNSLNFWIIQNTAKTQVKLQKIYRLIWITLIYDICRYMYDEQYILFKTILLDMSIKLL